MARLALRDCGARALFRPRPFVTAVSIVALLVTISYIQDSIFRAPSAESALLRKSDDTYQCRDIHHVDDVCAFVKANCEHEQPSLIPYLNIYYCTFGYSRISGFVLLTLWMGLLFSTIGIAASDFFSPNLQTIAMVLSMPENLTGVTFLALGNGSPDLFSTIMSMRSNSAALAVGELIGAASFITAVVAGSIAMIREFKVERHSFVRDIVFFIIAVGFTLGFLLDGTLRVFECIFMIVYYLFYVVVVSGSHFYVANRERRAALAEERARAVEESLREGGHERFRDEGRSEGDHVSERGRTAPSVAINAHARGASADTMPRIEIEGTRADEALESEQEHSKHIGAEIANSMRVRRPAGGRRSTANLIRPSLVGALELNSALERFRREGGHSEAPSPAHARRHSMQNVPQVVRARNGNAANPGMAADGMPSVVRDRAVSHAGNVTAPTGIHGSMHHEYMNTAISEGSASSGQSTPRQQDSRLPGRAFQLDGNLAVPPAGQPIARPDQPNQRTGSGRHPLAPGTLEIPSRRSTSSDHSETLTPFPGFTESPLPMTPTSEVGQPTSLQLPLLSEAANIVNNNINNCHANEVDGDGDDQQQTGLRWWPYSILPPPEDIWATLFPTLQNWPEKTTMDVFVSVLSVPTVFLLSITLPVVDTRGPDFDEEDECALLNGEIEASRHLPDTEWEEFRRHRRSHSCGSSGYATPRSPMSVGAGSLRFGRPVPKVVQNEADGQNDGLEDPKCESNASDELMGWKKWQVLVQIIAGPPFAVLIITSLLLEQPQDITVEAVKWSAVASAVLFLTVLIATKPDERPRFHSLLCFPGFLVSVAWIAAIAGEVVGALKAIGIIWNISEAILGLTIFAAGNSVGDWVSNYTIARLGSPVMAL